MDFHDGSALSPGTMVDQYTVSAVLGRGGFGITYLVRDAALNRDFALKEYFPQGLVQRDGTSVRFSAHPNSESDYRWGLRKFHDEARLLAQFSHPNIVAVRRVFQANNSAYMLLDFVRGSTLEAWLRGLDSPPTQEELDLVSRPLLAALELVHANHTWHLDISPDNILIRSADGEPILLDFGASRFELKQHSQLVSALVFKSGYSAPEQYTTNAGRLGPWTDIYAFGATLYRAISGRRLNEATERQLEDDDRPAALVGQGRYRTSFLEAIDWALKIPPRSRPQSVRDWRRMLLPQQARPAAPSATRITTGADQPRSDPSPAQPTARTGFPLWVLLTGMLAAVAAGAAGTYVVQEQLRKHALGEQIAREQAADQERRRRDAEEAARRQQESKRRSDDPRRRMLNTALIGDIIVTQPSLRTSLDCESSCRARSECKAYEYRTSSSLCYLYRQVSQQHDSTDAISGRWD